MKLTEIKIGMRVRYHPQIGGPHDGKLYVVRNCGHIRGEDLVFFEERSGCVSADAISRFEPGPELPRAA